MSTLQVPEQCRARRVWAMPEVITLSHSGKNYEHLESHPVRPHYLKDGKIRLLGFFQAKTLGLNDGFKHFLSANFFDFATFSFARQRLKFIAHARVCERARGLSPRWRGGATFCSVL